MAERLDLEFPSGNGSCAAWLYLPAKPSPAPVIVMAHGLGGSREMRLDAYAERFCAAGYACLVFDYRNFGASAGEPRQLLAVDRQLEDWRAAVACARSREDVDGSRVVLWGTSFAGGHVVVTAAGDHDIAAVIAQCPFTSGWASARFAQVAPSLKVALRAVRDLLAARRGKPPVMVDIAGSPGSTALMTAPDAEAGCRALIPAGASFDNRVTARAALTIPFYTPGKDAARVRCPILFNICEADSVAPAMAARRYARTAPRGELSLYPGGHFDIYVGEAFEAVVAEQTAFLAKHVPTEG